jgi:urease accessory protein
VTLAAAPGLTRAVRAELTFARANGRTHLMRQLTPHPFHITRPFHHPDDPDGMATLYLQSSSGGLYGDDDLGLTVRVGPDAAAHVTTQASTLVHDARGRPGASQAVTLDLAENSRLEFVPDPTILMSGARLRSRVQAQLAEGAVLILADAQLGHDPEGAGRPFARLEVELALSGQAGPILLDRFELDGRDWLTRTGGYRSAGTVLVAGDLSAGPAMAEAAERVPGVYAGLSTLADRGVSVLRFVAADGVALSRALSTIWAAACQALTGRQPAARRK